MPWGPSGFPDPTTAGDFCRRFAATSDHADLMRDDQRGPAEGLEAAAGGVLRAGDHRRRRHDGADHGRVQAGDGHLLRGPVGLPSAADLAGQHRGAVVSGQPQRQPAQPRGGGDVSATRRSRLCRRGGFKRILLRGDTDFTQTGKLDRWDDDGVEFIFGIDAMPNLVAMAERPAEIGLEAAGAAAEVRGRRPQERQRPENVKEQIVRQREFENIRLQMRGRGGVRLPADACQQELPDGGGAEEPVGGEGRAGRSSTTCRYFFYITNDRPEARPRQIVFPANDRCNQENLIEQLKNGVRAMEMPVGNIRVADVLAHPLRTRILCPIHCLIPRIAACPNYPHPSAAPCAHARTRSNPWS